MNILITILLVVAGIIALLLVMGLFMRKEHHVKREIVINAPRQKVFNFLKLLKNQDQFNKWAKADPDRNWEHKGTDGTEGFTISWKGNRKAGEGAKEIMKIIDGKRIETQIRFVRPMEAVANVTFETESISDSQTRVSMINSGRFNYPANILIPIMERAFPKDMDESLVNLKGVLEE